MMLYLYRCNDATMSLLEEDSGFVRMQNGMDWSCGSSREAALHEDMAMTGTGSDLFLVTEIPRRL
jgi:hypothetical protein